MVVISPHLDDAVFSCGEWLAGHPGATVVTVFAGVPTVGDRLTEWDARCGFGSAAEAVMVRRDEDRRAQALVEADAVWLDFTDSQYGESPDDSSVVAALER